MPIKPEDILSVAESLIENDASESEIRVSISRSYYSMYHKVISILDNEPHQYERKGVHASLIEYLRTDAKNDEKYRFNSLKSLSYMLKQEKDSRVTADYTLDELLIINNAQESILMAKKFFEKCDELKAG